MKMNIRAIENNIIVEKKTGKNWVTVGYYSKLSSALKYGPQEFIKGKDAKELKESMIEAYESMRVAVMDALERGENLNLNEKKEKV